MTILKYFIAFIAVWLSTPANGADVNGYCKLGGGAGSVACPEFVAFMEKARSLKINSPSYVQETMTFTMYLMGFQSGYNMSTPDTYDIFPDIQAGYPLLSWVENYCRVNPTQNFANGVVALAFELYPKRLRVPAK